ncbi:hypothetical protein FRC17_005953, partial [Serendipita sp. 399]
MSSVPEAAGSSDDRDGEEILVKWRASALEQEALLKQLIEENAELKRKSKAIEEENYEKKLAFTALRREAEIAQERATKSEAKVATLERDRTWVPILIDGDGYIFTKELLSNGETGGREAASMLNNGVLNYIRSQVDFPPTPVIYAMIFLSKELLENILVKSETCTVDDFKWFIKGFSQAHPLFSFITVGASKEAADSKIREHLNKFIRLHEVYRVFVGVDHDNGYNAALSAELTAGHKERLVLLRAHRTVAREILSLGLETLWVDGLFMPEKIPSNHFSPRLRTENLDSPSNSIEPLPKVFTTPPTQNASPQIGSATLPKRSPAPCNFHYLTGNVVRMDITISSQRRSWKNWHMELRANRANSQTKASHVELRNAFSGINAPEDLRARITANKNANLLVQGCMTRDPLFVIRR